MNTENVSVISGDAVVDAPKQPMPKVEYSDVELNIPSVTPTSMKALRSEFKKMCGPLVFRRISTVVTVPTDLEYTFIETPNEDGSISRQEFTAGSALPEFTKKELDQNVGEKYKKFSFYTTKTALRKNDTFGENQIFGSSDKYNELDILTFKPSKEADAKCPVAIPRKAELVCGIVELDKKKRPEFKFWFICSEQFFRTVSVILDPEYMATLGETPEEVRRTIVSGNKFSSSGYHRWVRACTEHNIASDYSELTTRFWTLRHEKIAREHSHVYTFLALLFLFNELPCDNTRNIGSKNVPNNSDMGPKIKTWDLPRDFVKKFCSTYRLAKVATGKTTIRKVTNTPEIPKGTHANGAGQRMAPAKVTKIAPILASADFPTLAAAAAAPTQ